MLVSFVIRVLRFLAPVLDNHRPSSEDRENERGEDPKILVHTRFNSIFWVGALANVSLGSSNCADASVAVCDESPFPLRAVQRMQECFDAENRREVVGAMRMIHGGEQVALLEEQPLGLALEE